MSIHVCNGALLTCTKGSCPASLIVLPKNRDVQHKAYIMDNKPFLNIQPFGLCTSLANPVVASATSANNGHLQPMSCIPNTPGPWKQGVTDVLFKEQPALLDKAQLFCMWAGIITIIYPGQHKENTIKTELILQSELMFYLPLNGQIKVQVVNFDKYGIFIPNEAYEKFIKTDFGIINNRKYKLLEKAEELEYLINKENVKEREFQNFFENNSEFILDGEYSDAIPQVILEENGGISKPDFILKPYISVPAKILELKLPRDNVISNYPRGSVFTQKVIKAVGQLKKYQRYFESKENRKNFYNKYQFDVYCPNLALIVGKDVSKIDYETLINLKETLEKIDIITYQEILEKYRQKIKHLFKK